MAELNFGERTANNYNEVFGRVSAHFAPFLLRAGRVSPGERVLDIACGTGLASEAALTVVGPSGWVTAADLSPEMVEQARARLGGAPNASVRIEDGQALSFADESFGVVLCSLGLMFFPDPERGLSEFRRVLQPGGRAAVSVSTVPELSFNGRIYAAIGRHVPAFAEIADRMFSLGDEGKLRSMFESAGFEDFEITTQQRSFEVASFLAFFEPYERGMMAIGQAYVALPEETRRTVRDEVRRELGDTGGPIEVSVEIRFASGSRLAT